MSFTKSFFLGDTEFEVEFESTPYVAARTSGPVENCHPAEGGECEIESVTVGGVEIKDFLNQETLDALQSKCEEVADECFEDERDSQLADRAEATAADREASWEY